MRTANLSPQLRIYARERIPHVWLVDPLAETMEVFRLDGSAYLLAAMSAGDEALRLEPFDAIALELTAIWGRR
ncbi:MAG: Uma2 family endonuclease [Myxococcales bacterium]